jgi:hypothetical protein
MRCSRLEHFGIFFAQQFDLEVDEREHAYQNTGWLHYRGMYSRWQMRYLIDHPPNP